MDIPDPVELARELIRCPSVTPADACARDVLERVLTSMGFECRRLRFEAPGTAIAFDDPGRDRGMDDAKRMRVRDFDDDIAVLAHKLWEARGCPDGSPEADWFQAAQELRARV